MIRQWLLALTMIFSAAAHSDFVDFGGLPDPWPFPWAKECPMNWENLNGYYSLGDSRSKGGEVTVRINVSRKNGLRLIHILRYSGGEEGAWLYEGRTYVFRGQKTVRLYLEPSSGQSAAIWAQIKLHYLSEKMDCKADHLVPILTMQKPDKTESDFNDYKMIRISD